MTHRVLFVCLGNICRSPLAEAAFREEAARIGLAAEADSAGTGGWHRGERPDRRAIAAARRNGVDISHLRARQVLTEDFEHFDHVVALDSDNLADLLAQRPARSRARLSLLLDHVPGREGEAVADPYYGDDRDFDITWRDGPTRSNSCIITACQKRCGAQRNQRRASTSHSLAGAAPIADAYHTDPTKILKLLSRERGIRPTMPQAKPDNNNCD